MTDLQPLVSNAVAAFLASETVCTSLPIIMQAYKTRIAAVFYKLKNNTSVSLTQRMSQHFKISTGKLGRAGAAFKINKPVKLNEFFG
jgi:hypothetical protein